MTNVIVVTTHCGDFQGMIGNEAAASSTSNEWDNRALRESAAKVPLDPDGSVFSRFMRLCASSVRPLTNSAAAKSVVTSNVCRPTGKSDVAFQAASSADLAPSVLPVDN